MFLHKFLSNKIYRTGASSLDAIQSHTLDTLFLWEGISLLQGIKSAYSKPRQPNTKLYVTKSNCRIGIKGCYTKVVKNSSVGITSLVYLIVFLIGARWHDHNIIFKKVLQNQNDLSLSLSLFRPTSITRSTDECVHFPTERAFAPTDLWSHGT